MAEDIVENGLSPIDLLLVMPSKTENDRYIALEGNRRLLALKILLNPHVLGDHDDLTLRFAAFYLSRTNRSGIFNGGIIGGRDQSAIAR